MPSKKNYLTPKEVAEILMVSTSAIRSWSEKGELKAMVTAGGHRRYKLEDIQQFARDKKIRLNMSQDNQLRILIVDDEPIFAEYVQAVLEANLDDVQVEVSSDGFDAGLKLKNFEPMVVLLDLMMPNIDGFQVCEHIKQSPQHKNVRVIAMSGDASEENINRILRCGAETCLAKPFDVQQLLLLLNH